jgi:hypothetical protein
MRARWVVAKLRAVNLRCQYPIGIKFMDTTSCDYIRMLPRGGTPLTVDRGGNLPRLLRAVLR